jgi:hypothetical protein
MNDDEIWEATKECFGPDDGSLPTLEVLNLSPSEIERVYLWVRKRVLILGKASFWDRELASERGLDAVPNAASLIASGKADAFHFVATNWASAGPVPPIGLQFFEEAIGIDYRMGSDWTKVEVCQLVAFLSDLVELTTSGKLGPSVLEGPPCGDAFAETFERYRRERAQ